MPTPTTVIIFSSDSDVSTFKVMSWLKKENVGVIKVCDEDYLQIVFSPLGSLEIRKNNLTIKISSDENKFTGIWFRRGNLSNFIDYNLPESLQEVVLRENIKLTDFLYTILERHPNSLGSMLKERSSNKLLNLLIAEECGLTIPKTFISSKVVNQEDSNYLTKSMNNNIDFNYKGYNYSTGFPVRLGNYSIKKVFPSLYQKEIKKKFEVRTFYLKGEFFSMAIFSQKNKNTILDYRNYDKKTPNRIVPFSLPYQIKQKLENLLNKLNLDTGSIDLIYSKENEFVFLEINPVGQFDWLSLHCNYQIEKKIAKILSNNES